MVRWARASGNKEATKLAGEIIGNAMSVKRELDLLGFETGIPWWVWVLIVAAAIGAGYWWWKNR